MFDSTVSLTGTGQQIPLPPEMSENILEKSKDQSAILKVAPRADMSITGNSFIIRTSRPEVDVVGEGGRKPVSGLEHTTFTVKPLKIATIVTWSTEARLRNPAGVVSDIQNEMSAAIARGIDQLIIHGRSPLSGQVVSDITPLSATANSVRLGQATAAQGGLASEIVAGAQLVDAANGEFTGLISDSSLRLQYLNSRDTLGRPLNTGSVNINANVDSILGVPNTYSRAVRGDLGANTDSGIRAIGGDFQNALRVGFVKDITYKISDSATLVDGDQVINLWQDNLEAALIEAIFSFVVFDSKKFVKYTAA